MGNSIEFASLRARAREKRDRAISEVRSEYAATLTRIATLERDLLGGSTPRRKTVSSCVEAVMPAEPFTLTDIVARLEALDAARVWSKRSVANHVNYLAKRGLVRRLRRHHGSEPTVYVRAGFPKARFEGVTLSQAIRSILTKPLNETEITVRLREQEYPSDQTNGTFRASIRAELRKGFRQVGGGKWAAR